MLGANVVFEGGETNGFAVALDRDDNAPFVVGACERFAASDCE